MVAATLSVCTRNLQLHWNRVFWRIRSTRLFGSEISMAMSSTAPIKSRLRRAAGCIGAVDLHGKHHVDLNSDGGPCRSARRPGRRRDRLVGTL